jgi:hypothetical protein
MAAFAMLWVTNLFNFMDGADGLAGGMALFAFGTYGYVAAATGVMPLGLWSLAVAGAAAGFLLFNFSPARVFLGDGGSITVGFLAGAFGIWGWAADAWPVWFPFLVSAPFFLDATATILRRMLSGEPFWRAHREHYYQRMIRSGWSHRRTALCEYMLMAASAGLAVLMLDWSAAGQYAGLAGAAAVYVVLAWAVDQRWAGFQNAATAATVTDHPIAARHSGMSRPRTPDGYATDAMKTSHRGVPSPLAVATREHRARLPVDEHAFHRESQSTEAKQL